MATDAWLCQLLQFWADGGGLRLHNDVGSTASFSGSLTRVLLSSNEAGMYAGGLYVKHTVVGSGVAAAAAMNLTIVDSSLLGNTGWAECVCVCVRVCACVCACVYLFVLLHSFTVQ